MGNVFKLSLNDIVQLEALFLPFDTAELAQLGDITRLAQIVSPKAVTMNAERTGSDLPIPHRKQ
ncbi:hypothetical protein PAENIP36_70730 [Paenibacillus sp. P36]